MQVLKTVGVLGTVFVGCCVICGLVKSKVDADLDNLSFDVLEERKDEDTETLMRARLQKECKEYCADFSGIEELQTRAHNYNVAAQAGNYHFEGCPTVYECLKRNGAQDLCEQAVPDNVSNDYDECYECWRRALQGVNGDV